MQGVSPFEQSALWTIIFIALISLAYAFIVRKRILAQDVGKEAMQKTLRSIKTYADSLLKRQLLISVVVAILLTLGCTASVLFIFPTQHMIALYGESATLWSVSGRALGFLMGSIFPIMAHFITANLAIESNIRSSVAAEKGYHIAMHTAYRSGMVAGVLALTLVGLSAAVLVMMFRSAAMEPLATFGLGGLVATLLTWTIRNPAIDQEIEQAIRQDKSDTPSTESLDDTIIEHLIGHIKRNSAGPTAVFAGILAMTIALAYLLGVLLNNQESNLALFPLLLGGIGMVASIIGNTLVQTTEQRRNARFAMSKGFYVTAMVGLVGVIAITPFALDNPSGTEWRPCIAASMGIILATIVESIIYLSAPAYFNPYKEINRSSLKAKAMMGQNSLLWGVFFVIGATLSAYLIFLGEPIIMIWYSISITGMGVLVLAGNVIATETLGAVAHNGYTISKIAGLGKNARNTMEDMKEVGAMMKGMTRGIAAGASFIALVALLGFVYAIINVIPSF